MNILNADPFYSSSLPKSIFLDRFEEFKFSVVMSVSKSVSNIAAQGLSFSLGSSDYLEVLTTKSIDYADWKIRYDVSLISTFSHY
jgi:hypothetical protein